MDRNARFTKEAYFSQKYSAGHRGLGWNFTYDTWCDLWEASNHWEERGNTKNKFVMARYGDVGPYSPDNVMIMSVEQNNNDKAIIIDNGTHASKYPFAYEYDGVWFDRQIEIAEVLKKSLRTIQKMVSKGVIRKYKWEPDKKVYYTPVGKFYKAKDALRTVRAEFRKDITRQALWHRYSNDEYPEYYTDTEDGRFILVPPTKR